jgi:hypothetical protein
MAHMASDPQQVHSPAREDVPIVKRDGTHASSESIDEKADFQQHTPPVMVKDAEDNASLIARKERWQKIRPFVLSGTALLILAWWISSLFLIRNHWYGFLRLVFYFINI